MSLIFIFNSMLLGVGLAMDAFSVSIANGLTEPGMRRRRMCCIAGIYAGFQFLMPMVGWVCVRTVAERFTAFQSFIPWIALILLCYIGGKMLWEGLHQKAGTAQLSDKEIISGSQGASKGDVCPDSSGANKAYVCSDSAGANKAYVRSDSLGTNKKETRLTPQVLLLQGIATSIDALSVGFTIESYSFTSAFVCSVIIAVVTFVICMVGLVFGHHLGNRISDKAQVAGGLILIGIGLEIFIRHFL